MMTKLLPIFFLLSATLQSKAQDFRDNNMIKTNLSSFVLKGFGIQYERKVSARTTIAVGYSMIPTSGIVFKSLVENYIDDPSVNIEDFKLGTSIITPEVRYYFGKDGAFHGFYLAGYLRYGHYRIQGPVSYTSSNNTTRSAVFNGKLNSFTGGIMMGSSFPLSRRLYLDWWILGVSAGGANGSFEAQTELSDNEQTSLKRELDDVDVPYTRVTSQVSDNGATVTTKGNMVGIRGLGLNLGIRF